jgi:hypothetical protein
LRIVIVFPLPLDSLDPRAYRLEDGEMEFGSKVKPGEASGDGTPEAAQAGVDPEVAALLVLVDLSGVLVASIEPPRSLTS